MMGEATPEFRGSARRGNIGGAHVEEQCQSPSLGKFRSLRINSSPKKQPTATGAGRGGRHLQQPHTAATHSSHTQQPHSEVESAYASFDIWGSLSSPASGGRRWWRGVSAWVQQEVHCEVRHATMPLPPLLLRWAGGQPPGEGRMGCWGRSTHRWTLSGAAH